MSYTLGTAIYLQVGISEFHICCSVSLKLTFTEKKKEREKPAVFQGDQKPISGSTIKFDGKCSH